MACGNIIKEDQDFGTVESQKSPLLPLAISYRMPFNYLRQYLPKIKTGEWPGRAKMKNHRAGFFFFFFFFGVRYKFNLQKRANKPP